MSRIINGSLFIPSCDPTGNPGEYNVLGATYTNFTDATGNGAYDLQTGFIVYVLASDINTFLPVPGVSHRYKITSLNIVNFNTIDVTLLWDENGAEIDAPTSNSLAIISQPGEGPLLGLPVSSQVYSELPGGLDLSVITSDRQYRFANVGGGLGDVYNPICRYPVETASGKSVWITSSSTFVGNVAWARSGTVLTLTKENHGRSVGERVILRNVNEDYLVAVILTADANTFTVDCTDVGELSGTKGLMGLGFTFAHNGNSGEITGGEVYAPANANVQLLSMRIHLAANERLTTIYNITVPASAINGAGANSGEEDLYAPICSVRQQSPGNNITMTAVGFTLTKAIGGAYNTFQLAALGATTTPLNIQLSF